MYRFNLESLLQHRKYQEEICQKECFDIEQRLLIEKEKMRKMELEQMNAMDRFRKMQESNLTSAEFIMYTNYFRKLKIDMMDQNKKANRVTMELNKKRKELIQATQKRKTLEHLKEKGLNAYREKMLKKEQDLLDEVSINAFTRNKE